jgi:hypothetical protein
MTPGTQDVRVGINAVQLDGNPWPFHRFCQEGRYVPAEGSPDSETVQQECCIFNVLNVTV